MLFKKPSPKKLKEIQKKHAEEEVFQMVQEAFLKKRTLRASYDPWMSEKILQIGEQGGDFPQMIKALEVKTKATFFKWLDEHEEFKDAYELAQIYCQAYWQDKLQKGAMGEIDGFSAPAFKLFMSAKFPEYKQESGKTEININSNNTLEKMDPALIDERIRMFQEKLGLTHVSDTVDAEFTEVVSVN